MSTSARVGYNGGLHESGTHWQLLGNGRRAYNPVLMRFHSPDRLSPFGAGGINGYAYCGNDPINLGDPSGQFAVPLMALLGVIGGAGAAGAGALASTGSSENDRGNSSALPWIIGGVIAALGGVAGAGMAGRQRAMNLKGRGNTLASSTMPRPAAPTSSATLPASGSPPRSAKPVPLPPVPVVRRDINGMELRHMSQLPDPVSRRVAQIRDFGPASPTPDVSQVQNAKQFANTDGRLPHDRTGHFYHQFPIYFKRGHGYEGWRIVTGSTRKSGLKMVYVTPDHSYFVKVDDWSGSRI